MAALKTPWYDKAVEALKLNGKSERTQEAYARHVRKLIEFYDGKDPDKITEDELKKYFIHRQDVDKWQPNTMRICYSGIKLFYLHVVQRYLGHSQLETTMVYLHLTSKGQDDSFAIINNVMKGVDYGSHR